MVSKYNIDKWLPDGFAIQGEICGVGIQKNPLELQDHELFIFNVFDIKEQKYLNPFHSDLPLEEWFLVPLKDWGYEFNYTLEEILEKANASQYSSGKRAEGLVVRSWEQSISFKVINNNYLLKDEE
jgi:hypothetical protein